MNENNDYEEIKRINIYSKKFKIGVIILICLLAVVVALNFKFLYENHSTYIRSNFNQEFSRYCHYVVDAKLNLQNEKHIREVWEQRSENKDYINGMVKKRTNDLKEMNLQLERSTNFVYIIESTVTERIAYTNIQNSPNVKLENNKYIYENNYFENPIEILKLQNNYMSIIKGAVYDPYNLLKFNPNFGTEILRLLKDIDADTKYNIHFGLIKPFQNSGDIFFELEQDYIAVSKFHNIRVILSIVIIILIILLIFIIMRISGQQQKDTKPTLYYIDKIPLEIYILAVFIGWYLLCDTFIIYSNFIFIAFLIFLIALSLICLCSISRRFKSKAFLNTTLTYKIILKLYYYTTDFISIFKSEQKYHILIFLIIISVFIAFNGGLYYILFKTYYNRALRLLILFTVFCDFLFVAWLVKLFISIKRLNIGTYEISKGNIKYKLEKSEYTDLIKPLILDINKIQQVFIEAVEKAVKDERLKTELITNVSHDLKTPLTSIINYIGLLKKEDLKDEKACNYLNILDEKSNRLKQLIEDLIEASKASSGNIAVKLEKLDLQQLVLQSYGEYEDKLSKLNLDIHINSIENQILVYADGKHMWRIISNLLSNVSKYSCKNSRVYIDISKDDNFAIVSIKNISEYELNIAPEHLTQRFVRGDVSRTTEGSGLGLSISQSLTELQGGIFNIDIDGDLFKVTIKIPLYK